jgi:hypothetical protein
MRLLGRAPREVYRVYDEDEYLAGETWGQRRTAADASEAGAHGKRLRRTLSLAILIAAAGAFGAVVALNVFTQSRVTGRRFGSRHRSAASSLVASSGAHLRVRQRTYVRAPARRDGAFPRVETVADAARSRVRMRHSSWSAHLRQELAAAAVVGASRDPEQTTSPAVAEAEPAEFGFER